MRWVAKQGDRGQVMAKVGGGCVLYNMSRDIGSAATRREEP
jgi:hypothetical protein